MIIDRAPVYQIKSPYIPEHIYYFVTVQMKTPWLSDCHSFILVDTHPLIWDTLPKYKTPSGVYRTILFWSELPEEVALSKEVTEKYTWIEYNE